MHKQQRNKIHTKPLSITAKQLSLFWYLVEETKCIVMNLWIVKHSIGNYHQN